MPGDRLCTAILSCNFALLNSADNDFDSCCKLRLVAPYAANLGVGPPSAPAPSMRKMWPLPGC